VPSRELCGYVHSLYSVYVDNNLLAKLQSANLSNLQQCQQCLLVSAKLMMGPKTVQYKQIVQITMDLNYPG